MRWRRATAVFLPVHLSVLVLRHTDAQRLNDQMVDGSVPPPTISNGNIAPSRTFGVWRGQFWRRTTQRSLNFGVIAPQISVSGGTTIWYFVRENPSGYTTSVVLTSS